jgi:hypothetical protein
MFLLWFVSPILITLYIKKLWIYELCNYASACVGIEMLVHVYGSHYNKSMQNNWICKFFVYFVLQVIVQTIHL